MPGLKYIGKDPKNDWLPGVPMRNLTAAEAKEHPEAAESRFYRAEAAPKTRKPRVKPQPKTEASPAGHGEEEQEN
jgi:hypothetical protein